MKKWTIEDARELYNIGGWGTSYFGINDEGNVYVTPCKDSVQIDLREVMDELALRDVTAPVLLLIVLPEGEIEYEGAATPSALFVATCV
jgi:arginine decarboxylase